MTDLITTPGIYPDISIERYHGEEICDGPSISSSGLKLVDVCPRKYWFQSPLNPNRPERKASRALNMGKAIHDVLEKGHLGPDFHIVPDGFSPHHHKKWAEHMADYHAAVDRGAIVIQQSEADTATVMIEELRRHELADALFSNGVAEATLAWKDKETGVWLRVRPDWLPSARRYIPDYKSCLDASPAAFSRAVDSYDYYCSAALYLEGIWEIFGEKPHSFIFVAQEKAPPHIVQLYQLDEGARSWGAAQNRRAIRKFADCLAADKWPGYGQPVELIDLPVWRQRDLIAQAEAGLLEYAA